MRLIKTNYVPFVFDDIFSNNSANTETAKVYSKPAVNINESEKAFEIEMAIPGMDKNDFKIEVKDKMLTLSGEKNNGTTEEKVFSRREFNFSSFKRSFVLPETVNPEEIEAVYRDGILSLNIPKKEEAKMNPRKIKVA